MVPNRAKHHKYCKTGVFECILLEKLICQSLISGSIKARFFKKQEIVTDNEKKKTTTISIQYYCSLPCSYITLRQNKHESTHKNLF